jgi:hypothetical protein
MKKSVDELLQTDFDEFVDEDLYLEDDGYSDYDYLRYDVVESGYYISRIVHAEFALTNRGDKAYDVYYKLVKYSNFYRWDTYEIDDEDVKHYYVKQRYKKGSISYKKFIKAMINAGLNKRFKITDVIGVIEAVFVTYPHDDNMGSITERKPIENNGSVFTIDENDD